MDTFHPRRAVYKNKCILDHILRFIKPSYETVLAQARALWAIRQNWSITIATALQNKRGNNSKIIYNYCSMNEKCLTKFNLFTRKTSGKHSILY